MLSINDKHDFVRTIVFLCDKLRNLVTFLNDTSPVLCNKNKTCIFIKRNAARVLCSALISSSSSLLTARGASYKTKTVKYTSHYIVISNNNNKQL